MGTGGERVDGEGLLPGLPGVEEEQLPLGRVVVPGLPVEGGKLGLDGGEAEAGGGLGIHRMGSHVVAVDAGVVGGHAAGQRLNKGPIVPRGGPQVEGSDGGLAAHRLHDEVGKHVRAPGRGGLTW